MPNFHPNLERLSIIQQASSQVIQAVGGPQRDGFRLYIVFGRYGRCWLNANDELPGHKQMTEMIWQHAGKDDLVPEVEIAAMITQRWL